MARSHAVQTPGAPAAIPNPESVPLAGLSGEDVVIEVGGHDVPLDDIVRGAYETAGISIDEWNALEGVERDELIAKKRKELVHQFREAGDSMPSQRDVQARAQAAAEARRAARRINPNESPADALERLPHSSEIDPAEIVSPIQCRDGILVPSVPRKLPQNFR